MEIRVINYKSSHMDKARTLSIPEGLVYIIGNNGSGKTLLLDAIAGLSKTKSGAVIGNKDNIYLNQSTYFSDKLKTKELLGFTYLLDGKCKGEKDFFEFIIQNLESSLIDEIRKILNKRWGILSGGERKFIYALIILSIERKCYIMDEPFAYVDYDKKKVLIDIIKKKLRDGKSVIVTSHEHMEDMEALHPYKIVLD